MADLDEYVRIDVLVYLSPSNDRILVAQPEQAEAAIAKRMPAGSKIKIHTPATYSRQNDSLYVEWFADYAGDKIAGRCFSNIIYRDGLEPDSPVHMRLYPELVITELQTAAYKNFSHIVHVCASWLGMPYDYLGEPEELAAPDAAPDAKRIFCWPGEPDAFITLDPRAILTAPKPFTAIAKQLLAGKLAAFSAGTSQADKSKIAALTRKIGL